MSNNLEEVRERAILSMSCRIVSRVRALGLDPRTQDSIKIALELHLVTFWDL